MSATKLLLIVPLMAAFAYVALVGRHRNVNRASIKMWDLAV
ncbi:hypothetical protein [Phyllobacterium zundukense]|uniref:Uncharacterized protein n=1 Tax=Phyllobacterium zundukense TaxID=1867719 RepID=A0ACD4CXB5_9HYPH|nr:hypothetical protein [Phyllobacterium zundukense]UXN58220.1 hypothetical protein N8E88_05220 [Phyllobacterium zundukense]